MTIREQAEDYVKYHFVPSSKEEYEARVMTYIDGYEMGKVESLRDIQDLNTHNHKMLEHIAEYREIIRQLKEQNETYRRILKEEREEVFRIFIKPQPLTEEEIEFGKRLAEKLGRRDET